jgi:hypothetical protein
MQEAKPFDSTLEYMMSLSRASAARAGHSDAPSHEAEAVFETHRERELASMACDDPAEHGPFGLADACGFHVLEVRVLAYLFLHEGTVPGVPVFLDQEEMVERIANLSEAKTVRSLLEPHEALVGSGCILCTRVGERWMVALTQEGRAALVHGDLPSAAPRVDPRQMRLALEPGVRDCFVPVQ